MPKRTPDQVIALLRRRYEMRTGSETHVPVPVDWIGDLIATADSGDSATSSGEKPPSSGDTKPKRRRTPKPST